MRNGWAFEWEKTQSFLSMQIITSCGANVYVTDEQRLTSTSTQHSITYFMAFARRAGASCGEGKQEMS